MSLPEPLGRLEAAGVVGDAHGGQLQIAERAALLEAQLAQPAPQLLQRHRQCGVEVLVAALQEVVGVAQEELQIALEDAEAMAELVRPPGHRGEAGHMLGHVDQGLVGDREHLRAAGSGQQLGTGLRKGAPALVRVQRIAHAQGQHPGRA
jgi:hypothetical protein